MFVLELVVVVLRFFGFVLLEIELRSCGFVLVGIDYEVIVNSMVFCFCERGSVRKREMEDYLNDGFVFYRFCCIVDLVCGNDFYIIVFFVDINK